LELFVTKGYHRVSIPQIVEASGVRTGAIYNLFGNKENLARTLQQQLRAFAELVYEETDRHPITMECLLFMKRAEFMDGMAPVCMMGSTYTYKAFFKHIRGIRGLTLIG